MRLIAAELLKLRKRLATYVVLGVLLIFMAIFYLLSGIGASTPPDPEFGSRTNPIAAALQFPRAYGIINNFIFGLGSLFAVTYAAAVGGADWNWGTVRLAISRGESRAWYVLAKFIALALMLLLGILIAYAAGIALTYLAAGLGGVSVGNPLSPNGIRSLRDSIGLGYYTLLEQSAIGFALAMIARSQLAGIVMGILFSIGETIISLLLNGMAAAVGGQGAAEWIKYAPFSASNAVLGAAPASGPRVENFLPRLDLPEAALVTTIYLVLAIALSALVLERAEIAS